MVPIYLGSFVSIVWHFRGWPIFGILREIIVSIVEDWFCLLGVYFCDFQEAVIENPIDTLFTLYEIVNIS